MKNEPKGKDQRSNASIYYETSCLFLQLVSFTLALFYCVGAYAQQAATAVATVANGSVTSVTITSGGSGYISPPNVAFIGGGGTGASANTQVGGGSMTNIIIQSPGNGYTNAPIVDIDPPPPQVIPAVLSLSMAHELTINGQPWSVQQLQYAKALGGSNQWIALTNILMDSSQYVYVDTDAAVDARFYRVATLEPPGPDPAQWTWINPGTFMMGSPDTEHDRSSWEGPQTQVTITNGFWIGRFLVTQGEYLALVGTNSSAFTNDLNLPVDNLSWYDASNYCALLTRQGEAAGHIPAGYLYRLPTEAEWEYATRAGTTNRFFFGDDPAYTLILNYGWIQTNSAGTTHDVGQKLPNQWGLYDTSGNVFEWCADYYDPYPGGSVTNPIRPPVSTNGVVMRGGSFLWTGYYARSAARAWYGPDSGAVGIGFRVVLAPPLN